MADSKFTNFRRRRRSRVDYVHFSEHFGNNEPGYAHRRAQRRRHSCWVRGYLRDRAEYGAYNRLMGDLRVHDSVKLKIHLRIEPDVFVLVNAIVKTSSTSAFIYYNIIYSTLVYL